MEDLLNKLDATDMASKVANKEISPVELIQSHLDQIDRLNPSLNAIVEFAADSIDRAKEAENALYNSGCEIGPLHGVPYTIKDSINVEGYRTSSGSLLTSKLKATENAPVAERLKNAGGILLGKTNTPEFTLWWETDNRVFGRTNNPWDLTRTPGGSSGGESAAIAALLSPIGIGSDSGGSIRVPASYCGIFGLKPTHGRVPITGHIPYTLTEHTHIGPMARSTKDISLALNIIEGPDYSDHYAVNMPPTNDESLDNSISNLKLAWYTDGPFQPISESVKSVVENAINMLKDMRCNIVEANLGFLASLDPMGTSGKIASIEGGRDLGPLFAGKEDLLGVSMQSRLSLPKPSHEEYLQALLNRQKIRQGFMEFFKDVDILICPTSPVSAPKHNELEKDLLLDVDGVLTPGRTALMSTLVYDLTGAPAISIPFGKDINGMPIGIQIVGRHFEESIVLNVAYKLEQISNIRNITYCGKD